MAPTPTVLDCELYEEPLAARLLDVAPSTLHWWLEGRDQYLPVLRAEPNGSRVVTWGEFVEARYLREYRRTHHVPLGKLRDFIAYLRRELGVPYPLATARPWVGPDRRLFINAQDESGLEPDWWACVEPQTGVMLLTYPAESFLERVEFDDTAGVVSRLHPAGRESPVVIDPEIRFGSPAVRGIPTENIAEQVSAGDSVESVAADFDLPLNVAIAALNYEDPGSEQAA